MSSCFLLAYLLKKKIIITGGKSTEQLVESYDFITNVLSDREKFHMK